MSLNQVRILALTLLGAGELMLILGGFIEAVILGAMLIIIVLWLVSEAGTHASYTIRIGQMLEMAFKPIPKKPQPKQVISNEGLQVTNEKAHNKLYKLEDGEELTGNDENPKDYVGRTSYGGQGDQGLIKDELADGGVNNPNVDITKMDESADKTQS